MMIFGQVGAGGPDWGGVVGVGGAMAGKQMGQGVGTRSARWQGREGMAGGRWARYAVAGGGEEGVPEVVAQEADGRRSGLAGAVAQGGPDGWEGGDGRVHS